MARYIDADVLKEKMLKYGFRSADQTITEFVEDILPTADVVKKEKWDRLLENSIILADAVQKYQLADVVEVKHGRWIKDRLCSTSGGTYGVRRCSVCEDYYQDIGYGWNFCPNCGADMRGEENE